MKTLFSIIVIFFISINLYSQLAGPESVVWDEENGRYLVSDAIRGRIFIMNEDNSYTEFTANLKGPKGLEIFHGSLWVSDVSDLVEISLQSGQVVNRFAINGAMFLNDLAKDNLGNFYLSDSQLNKIYKFNTATQVSSEFISEGISSPNGLLFDPFNNRLLMVSFKKNSSIDAVDLSNGSIQELINTGYNELDGITINTLGSKIYISSWGNNSIIEYEIYPDGMINPEPNIITSEYDSPADIYYNKYDDRLAIPSMSTGSVNFIDFDQVVVCPSDIYWYDQGKYYLVVDNCGGNLLRYDKGTNSYGLLLDKMVGPLSVTVVENKAFITDLISLVEFDLIDMFYNGEVFLNTSGGIEYIVNKLNSHLYISDFDVIWEINLQTDEISFIEDALIIDAEGLYYNAKTDELIFVGTDLDKSSIYSVNLKNDKVTREFSTTDYNFDDIIIGENGDFILSDYDNGKIIKLKQDFSGNPQELNSNLTSPKGICLNPDGIIGVADELKQYPVFLEDGTTGIIEISGDDDIKLYPQPANDLINIKLQSDEEINHIELIDMTGRKINADFTLQKQTALGIPENIVSINLNNCGKGAYILLIKAGSLTFSKKFIKL